MVFDIPFTCSVSFLQLPYEFLITHYFDFLFHSFSRVQWIHCWTTAFKKAVLLVDSKSAIQTVASNKQATTQTVKEAKRIIKLLNRQGKTVAFQWVPSHVRIHGNESANLLAKKGTTLQNKQTPPNFETIKRLIKQKTTKILPGSHCLIQQETVAKHQYYMGKQQNKPRK